MDINLEKGTITIFGKSEKLNSLALKLSAISGEQVYSFFTNKSCFIPRMLNIYAMYSVLNDKIKDLSAASFEADYLMKLKYYNTYSETQLFNLFYNLANDTQSFKQYRINLMKLILINARELNIADGELQYLKNLGKMKVEDYVSYFQYITSISVEALNTFDGVEIEALKENLSNSCSNEEILDIAAKYGIEFEISEETTPDVLASTLLESLAEYSLVTMDVSEFVILDEFKPLEFELNVDAIMASDETKRAISYLGEENDEFNPILIPEEEPEGLVVNVVESNIEEPKEEEVLEQKEEIVEENIEPNEEEKKEEKVELEEVIPLEVDDVESTSTEKQLGFNDVRINHLRGDTKIEKYIKAPIKLIVGSIAGALAIALAVILIVILVK